VQHHYVGALEGVGPENQDFFGECHSQSKELVEGLQKLVQHFDARGLPVAGSGPRSSV
jgi:hypothetical protein